MLLSRLPILLASLAWGYLALRGFDVMSDIAAQNVPGFPNSGQRNYYLHIPLGMALLSLALLGASLRNGWAGATGCVGAIMLVLMPPDLIFYTGGM
ncbi:MAG: hypothetical protein EOP62_10240 [Sphingomonadales bacterium]|nr:MAG: hypothetical protein EOP62_10240 [Sphingomonadales bacterium]